MSFILLGILNSQIDAAGGGSYDLLETEILTSAVSSVEFTGLGTLAAGFQHLQLRVTARTDRALELDGVHMRFNGDTGTNYARHNLEGDGSAVTSGNVTSQAFIRGASLAAGNTAPANIFGAGVIDILDFSSTAKNTTIRSLTGVFPTVFNRISLRSGAYFNTSAVTSIELTPQTGPNFLTGSRFSLYGIRGE